MKYFIFVLFLFTSLSFAQTSDINAKTEKSKQEIMEFSANCYAKSAIFEKHKNSLWFKDEEFLRELLKETCKSKIDDIMKNVENKNILNDKEIFLQLIQRNNGHIIKFASKNLKNNKEFILKAIEFNGDAFKNASKQLKDDKEFVLIIADYGVNIFKHVSKRLKNDKEVVLEALKYDANLLEYASKRLKDNKEVILKALKYSGHILKYVSKRLKNDKEIVLKTLIRRGYIDQNFLKNLAPQLKKDKKFIFEIIKINILALEYVDKTILEDKDIVLYYLKELEKYQAISHYNIDTHHSIFKRIDPLLLDNEEIMSKAVSVLGISLQYASKRVRKDKNIAKKAVSNDGLALQYVDKSLRGDKEIIIKAVSNDGLALQYVDKSLREDKEIIILALENNIQVHKYIPYKMKNYEEILKILKYQTINGYLQNKIKRKIKPLAWESYDINETLEILYGEDRVYEKSKDIHIKLPTNTSEHMDTSGYGRVNIRTNKKVKSIAILQKKEGDRALTALYYPYGNTVNFLLPLKILNASLTMMIEGMKVVVITETEDNHLFINEYTIQFDYMCMNGYGMKMYLEDLKYALDTNLLEENALKEKYQIDENRVGYLKFMIWHPMVSYIEAEKLNVKVNFISHIKGRIKDKKLFDLYTSEYISKDPLIKTEFENMKQGENINFSYSTINGEVTSKEVKARKSKKKEK